jgi:succinate dehydrogenase / fumarate reductase cytochrome b subunit
MTAAAASVLASDERASRRVFVLRRLHSLSGVVPLGVFLVEHLWTNARALRGEASFDQAVGEIQAIPLLGVIEVVGIFLPLAFHALYGVSIALAAKPNVTLYPYTRNWLYVLQRVTGLFALVFIGVHLYEYRIHKWLFGMRVEAFYDTLGAHLSSTSWSIPVVALFYLLGIGATVFHFANGMWGFMVGWGLTVSRIAQRRAGWVCGVAGVLLFLLGTETVIFFATGARIGFPGRYVPLEAEVGGPCGAKTVPGNATASGQMTQPARVR